MKIETHYHHYRRKRSTGKLLVDLLIAGAVLVAVCVLTNCGGTFTVGPDGSMSYTSPQLIKPTTDK